MAGFHTAREVCKESISTDTSSGDRHEQQIDDCERSDECRLTFHVEREKAEVDVESSPGDNIRNLLEDLSDFEASQNCT